MAGRVTRSNGGLKHYKMVATEEECPTTCSRSLFSRRFREVHDVLG
jgi:hypothetical protein